MKVTPVDIILTLIPIITGFGASSVCAIKGKGNESAGESVKFRPPPVVFKLAWPILYLLTGISWAIAHRQSKYNNIPYSILTALLTSWIVVYGCVKSKQYSMYILILSLMASFSTAMVGTTVSKLMMAPLIGWLCFALIMSTSEIQTVSK